MMHTYITHHNIKKQAGVSVVTAIFLVVVLALMGVGMVSLISTSQQSISQEFTSAKAYMAGRSCLQWGTYQIVHGPTSGSYTTTFNGANSGLIGTKCDTTVSPPISNDNLNFYNVNTIASIGGEQDPEFSQRELRLQFKWP